MGAGRIVSASANLLFGKLYTCRIRCGWCKLKDIYGFRWLCVQDA